MMMWPIPRGYEAIEYVPFIDSILLETPFITYPKRSTRDGMFTEVFENPLQDANINSDHWFCYPAKIGESLAYVYFHRDYTVSYTHLDVYKRQVVLNSSIIRKYPPSSTSVNINLIALEPMSITPTLFINNSLRYIIRLIIILLYYSV